jgi:hypothetical protein
MPKFRLTLRIVFYRESGRWIAHCLEMNLIGDGRTQAEALASLQTAITVQFRATLKYGNAANLFCPADPVVFQMFAAGRDVARGEIEFGSQPPLEVQSIEIRRFGGTSALSKVA